ncbi:sugar kinase [Planctomycetales bacterium]|nr:sugar kinase [Planctomycetales bacterium]
MACLCSGLLFADLSCHPIRCAPAEGEIVNTERITLSLGGNAANVAAGLNRLNVPVTLAGCVGDDALSSFIVQNVNKPGIDTRFLRRVPGHGAGTVMQINVRDEDRRFICAAGANDCFVFDNEMFDYVRSTPSIVPSGRKVIYLGGFFMLRALEGGNAIEFFRLARQYDWIVILDVVLNGQRDYWDILEPVLPYVDIILPNENEGEKITNRRDPYDQAKELLDAGAGSVVLTQGDGGTLCFSHKKQFRAGIYPANYVCGFGAGDAFTAGLIAAFLEGHEPYDSIRWGSAMGASAVREVSPTKTLFNREELLAFLDDNHLVIEQI